MGRAKGQGLGRGAEGGGEFRCGDADYHRWRTGEVTVGGEALAVVSKPGVLSFGELDPSAGLLLDHLEGAVAEGRLDETALTTSVVRSLLLKQIDPCAVEL